MAVYNFSVLEGKKNMAAVPLPPFRKLIAGQVLVASLVVIGAEWFWPGTGLSAFWGGVIAIVPQIFFALLVFRHRGARKVQQAVQLLLLGAAVKFGLTFALFVVVFALVQPSNPISLLCAYIAVISVHWLAPTLMRS